MFNGPSLLSKVDVPEPAATAINNHGADLEPLVRQGFLTVAKAVERAENCLSPEKTQELRSTFEEQVALSLYLDDRKARFMLTQSDQLTAILPEAKDNLDRRIQATDKRWLRRAQARLDSALAACNELLQLLRAGTLSSYVLTTDGSTEPVHPSFWQNTDAFRFLNTDRVTVPANELITYTGRLLLRAREIENVLGRRNNALPPGGENKRRGRGPTQRRLVERILSLEFAEGVPSTAEMGNQDLLRRVARHIPKGQTISNDTILRAAGRKR